MPNLNRVLLMGNLTRDPELRYLPNNTAVVGFGLAINRRWKSQSGEQQEEVTFIDCEAFGKTAEVINQYLRKGRPVFVDGRLKLDQWQDKEGGNRSKLKVIVESFQFIDSKGQDTTEADAPANAARMARASRPAPATGGAGQHEAIGESDIPFAPDAHSSIWS